MGGGKGGKEGGGAEKLKKAFAFGAGRPSTEKVPESVLTAEEKLKRMEVEFDGESRLLVFVLPLHSSRFNETRA